MATYSFDADNQTLVIEEGKTVIQAFTLAQIQEQVTQIKAQIVTCAAHELELEDRKTHWENLEQEYNNLSS